MVLPGEPATTAGTFARCEGSSRPASDCATFGVSGPESTSLTTNSGGVSFDRQPEKNKTTNEIRYLS